MGHRHLSRRSFLSLAARYGVTLGGAGLLLSDPATLVRLLAGQNQSGPGGGPGAALAASDLQELIRLAPRARFWISTRSDSVSCATCHRPDEIEGLNAELDFDHGQVIIKCLLCAQSCLIPEGSRGKCRTRINVAGELRTLSYGRPVAVHVDPIEKKPFYHFLPGSQAFSLATAGCPLHCKFCQNWEISQARPEDKDSVFVPPEQVVQASTARAAPVIAFTYNEPTVFTEYLTDIARLARPQGLRSVLISCGFMTEDPLTEMCECLDAIKIDLKGFSEKFYREVSSAELQPVLRSIKQVARSGRHLELVNLVVPTLNDSPAMLTELAKWVVGEIGPEVPVHFTRFHPDYQMLNLPPTPVATLERAYDIAREQGMHYAYVGNVPGHPGNQTYCPGCGQVVIQRQGFFVLSVALKDGKCTTCGQAIAGVWQ
jgi:pyruvate formate lyase activating enzyme